MKTDYNKNAKQKDLEARDSVKRHNVVHLQTETEVRAQLGGICRQTFYNMQKKLSFPGPTVRIGSKKFWDSTITPTWILAQKTNEQ